MARRDDEDSWALGMIYSYFIGPLEADLNAARLTQVDLKLALDVEEAGAVYVRLGLVILMYHSSGRI